MIKDVLNNAKIAKEGWEEYNSKKENLETVTKFKKFFHIRPTTSGYTIISTHRDKPMNGIFVNSSKAKVGAKEKTKLKLQEAISIISQNIKGENIDWNEMKFKQTGRVDDEYRFQAYFINEIIGNEQFKNILGVKELYFIGSEVILHEGVKGKRRKPDVLAHDGNGKVFFFELKRSGSKDNSIEQVNDYIKYYENDENYKELLLNYPMTEIKEIKEYIGWAVEGNEGKRNIEKIKDRYIKIS